MKNIFLHLSVIAFISVSIISCDKIKSKLLDAFTADGANFTFSLPPVSTTDSMMSLGTQTIYFDLDSTIKAVTSNNFSLSSINSVTPNAITLKIQNPDSANNFANFQTGTLSFTSNTNTTPYNFSFSNLNVYADSISIPLDTNTNLKSYMEGKNFGYTLIGKLRKITNKQLNVKANVKFKVH
jgi:hypothetical protein